jgi:hypothetical protein
MLALREALGKVFCSEHGDVLRKSVALVQPCGPADDDQPALREGALVAVGSTPTAGT